MSDDAGPINPTPSAAPQAVAVPTGFAWVEGGFSIPWARPVVISDATAPSFDNPPQSSTWPPPMSRSRATIELLLLATLIVGGYIAAGFAVMMLHLDEERLIQLVVTLGIGVLAVLLCAGLVAAQKQPLASIGWRTDYWLKDAGIGLVALAGVYAIVATLTVSLTLLYPELLNRPAEAQEAIERTFPRLPLGWLLPTTLLVALWEEVVFRGFLLTRLYALFRRWRLVIPLGTLVFALPHFYQGTLAVGMVAVLGLVMSLLFVWRRSLLPAIVLHWAHNTVIFLALGAMSPDWQ